jgi:hypothetical protein
MITDRRGYEIAGASLSDSDAFERILELHLSWQDGVERGLDELLEAAPQFTMARVLEAYLGLCSRDPTRVRRARSSVDRATPLPATHRERLHVEAINAALADDFMSLKFSLRSLLTQYPRDVLALQVAHAVDYLTGDAAAMHDHISAVLPHWSEAMPGYHAILAMHAFSLAEVGQYGAAHDRGQQALTLVAGDVRAHHALIHVHEMTGDASGGRRLMQDRIRFWTPSSAATHCWWHWALFHLTEGDTDAALTIYDHRIRQPSPDLAALIDASALLWRLDLFGVEVASRWQALSDAWAPHLEDDYCSFSDLHAMVPLVGARNWQAAARLETRLLRNSLRDTRYGETTQLIGLPASRAILAFGRERYARAAELLSSIPAQAARIGGSQAQRNLLNLTLLEAIRRIRPPSDRAAA